MIPLPSRTTRKTKKQIPPQDGFVLPHTISRKELLKGGSDDWMRDVTYRLVQALGRLVVCREAFGRQIDLTSSQFTVLIGVAYRQGDDGIAIAPLSNHIGLAATHVTTEVGRLIRKGLLLKRPNTRDRRSVLITLSPAGEQAVLQVIPVVRAVNDLLFKDLDRPQLEIVSQFANSILKNAEYALAEIRVLKRQKSGRKS